MAFPAITTVIDDFNRANESPATGWTTGPDGAYFTAAARVVSNQLTPISGDCFVYYNLATFGPVANIYIVDATTVTGGTVELWACASPIGTSSVDAYSVVRAGTAGPYTINRVDNGVTTQLGATIAHTFTAGDSWGIGVGGGTITANYKPAAGSWSEIGSRADATYSQVGRVVFYLSNANMKIEELRGGTVVTATTVTGATAAAIAVTPATAGIRSRSGASAASIVVTPVTSGTVARTGASAAAIVVTPATAGVRQRTGASAAAVTITPASAGAHTGVGASAAAIAVAFATAGTRKFFGASAAAVPFAFVTSAAAAAITGATTAGIVITPTTAGVFSRVGSSSLLISLTPVTTGRRATFGASAFIITLTPEIVILIARGRGRLGTAVAVPKREGIGIAAQSPSTVRG